MEWETSCGAVVFTGERTDPRFVIIKEKSGFYGFPKGHAEGDETEEETALREIREETGLSVTLLPGFRAVDEYALSERPGTMKRVIFFLAEYEDQAIVPQPEELDNAFALPYKDALERLTWESSKGILKRAMAFLRAEPTVSVSRAERGLGHPEAARLVKRAVAATLRAEGVSVPCHVDVLFCGDEAIRDINREQRNVDSATDVLSFPQNELTPGAFSPEGCEMDFDTGEIQLGDMVLSIPRCAAQGEEYGHGFTREVSYLAVHSTLHLLGYDHLDEGPQKRQMRAREDAVMERLEAGGKRK